MNRRIIQRAFVVFGSCVLALVAILSIDALIAVNRVNPEQEARVAAADAGWEIDQLDLEHVDVSGGPLGSFAVVTYRLGGTQEEEHLDVHLRRPLLTSNWKVIRLEPR